MFVCHVKALRILLLAAMIMSSTHTFTRCPSLFLFENGSHFPSRSSFDSLSTSSRKFLCIPNFVLKFNASVTPFCTFFLSTQTYTLYYCRASQDQSSLWSGKRDRNDRIAETLDYDDLGTDSAVYKNTLRLVECSMFSAVAGLAYLLSNSLAIENYFGCFFSLPIVISSIRWGVSSGRKTVVATTMLLLVLSGPVKAATYLLLHGLVGFTMGSLWRSGVNWGLSVFLCSFVRAVGAVGYVLLSSFLIRENILALITINIHAYLTYMISAIGINAIPSMNLIYVLFGFLVLLNCGFFVFLLHVLYAILLTRLGMKMTLSLPRWLQRAF